MEKTVSANDGRMTTREHWEGVHSAQPRMRLPSMLLVSTRNLQRLLTNYIKPGMKVLEIGYAPGKQLAYVAKILKANVSGIDYSESGVSFSRRLFNKSDINADLRCEDIFATTLERASFDFVYSVGLVEHFDDPSVIVRRHVELVKPGGTSLIVIPNYQGIYGRLQRYFDPDTLLIHNLNIMSCNAMAKLAPWELSARVETEAVGSVDPSLVSFHKKWPAPITRVLHLFLNGIGVLQPFDIRILSPWIAMTVVRAG